MYPSEEDVLRARIHELSWVRNKIHEWWPLDKIWPLSPILALIEKRLDKLELRAYEYERLRRGI